MVILSRLSRAQDPSSFEPSSSDHQPLIPYKNAPLQIVDLHMKYQQ